MSTPPGSPPPGDPTGNTPGDEPGGEPTDGGATQPGATTESNSRAGVIVGIGLALIVVLAGLAWLLLREDASDTATTPTPEATPTETPSDAPSPTAAETPTDETPTDETPAPTPDAVELRPDGVGPLELLMTKDEALATGVVSEEAFEGMTELVADPDELPGVFICWDSDADEITSYTVKDGSPIETPEGIGVTSGPDDLRAAYGNDLVEQDDNGEQWFTVPVDDVGYAFFPTDVELIMLSGTEDVLAVVTPGTEPC